MLEPVSTIKTLLVQRSYSRLNCSHRIIAKAKQRPTLKKCHRRHQELVDPYTVAVSKILSDLMAKGETEYGFQLQGFHFH